MSFPRYPKYKESGVDWLGEIPEHWEMKSARHLIARLDQGTSPNAGNVPAEDGEWGVLKLSAINRGLFKPGENKALAELPVGLVPLTPMRGDILLSRANTPERVGDAAYVSVDFQTLLIPDLIYRLQLDPAQAHARYFCSFLLSRACRAQIEADARGSSGSMVKLSQGHLRAWSIPVPPLVEQVCIAEFLELETAKVDELVAEQQRLIELLKEKRQTVISHAVTKGLNPHAPMKPSGIEWLGDVPAHWEVTRLGNLFHEVADPGSDELPVLTVSIHHGVSDKEVAEEEMDRKVTRIDDRSKYKRVRSGDLVYNMMRAWQGGFGTVTVDGMVSPAYVVARPRKSLETAYVENLLRTPQAIEQMRRHSQGVTDFRLRLYWDEFKNIRVALPPLVEAKAICAHIDEMEKTFRDMTVVSSESIALLQERRTALISAAVTGQIDVRHLAENEIAA